jgi:cysteine-S-conjugate beta-lyase
MAATGQKPMSEWNECIDRYASDSIKWRHYGQEVLPLWVADMDFRAPQPVLQALRARVDHGIFGYGCEPPELRPLIVSRLLELYRWQILPEDLVFLPGVVVGFNLATQAVTTAGDGVLVQTPIYYPILYAPGHAGCTLDEMELSLLADGRYEIDLDAFAATITPRTRIFILCNPHNPVGRVFRRDELERMAEICLRHDIVICSDEIHGDLVFSGHHHLPIASLDPEIASRTITLMAPSKTYNIAGLHFSLAIIQNPELRQQFTKARAGLVSSIDVMGYTAALAAYRHGQAWLDDMLAYLEQNRDWLLDSVSAYLPGVRMARIEGTYLAWLDCRQAGIPDNPHKFFLEKAHVALNDGATFGRGGEGFVRLNFACPRSRLQEALARMQAALQALPAHP